MDLSTLRNNITQKRISFSKIDWNSSYENSVYYKIGFSLDSISPPSSYWNINGKRIHRLNFIKAKYPMKKINT